MQILSLKIHNILSIADMELEFQDSGIVLVEGFNYDDGKANGAGKTAIFNALSFGLYDDVPRKITKTEILRRKAKKGSVEVTLKIKDDIYTVIRSRPKGVKFKKNGTEIDITQDAWENILKLSYKQFLISMYTAQGTGVKFIDLNDTNKKDFLLQLMSLSEFASCKKEADSEIKLLQKELDQSIIDYEKAKSQIEVYSENNINIRELKGKMINSFAEQQNLMFKIKELENVKKPDLSRYEDLESKAQEKINLGIQNKIVRKQRFNELCQLEKQLKPFDIDDTCFNCGATLDNEDAKIKHEENQRVIEGQIKTVKIYINDLDVSLEKYSQYENLMIQIKEKKRVESQEYTAAQNNIQQLKSDIRFIQNNFNIWEAEVKRAEAIIEKTKTLQQYTAKMEISIKEKQSQIEILKTVSQIYSPTGAPAYILDTIIETFNDTVSKYIGLLWPNADYCLKSYKENKDGGVVAKFSEIFTNNGQKCSIGSLSGGEKRALSLAIDFAVVDILSKNFGMQLNPVILDEPFEGLDSVGRETVVTLLQKIADRHQIFVIDHASEAKAMFTNIIRVEKRKGISSIVKDVV